MDALARLEPVARPLLHRVDDILASLGAPAEHVVWAMLRRVRATPADAVRAFAATDPGALRRAATHLRDQAGAYLTVAGSGTGWLGAAGGGYAARIGALNAHAEDPLAGHLTEIAGYADAVADWQETARRATAEVLARVLTSAEAATVLHPDVAGGVGEPSARAVRAAAEIGAHVLGAVAMSLAAAEALRERAARLPGPADRAASPTADNQTTAAVIDLRQ